MGNVGHLTRTVDDDKKRIVAFVEEHQVVQNATFVVQQQAVTLFARGQADHVHRHQRFEGGSRVRPHQPQLAHVGNVEQACGVAGMFVLGHQASGVLHRHGIPGKGHHAGAQLNVQGMQGCGQQVLGSGCHGVLQSKQQWRGSAQATMAGAGPTVRFT